MLLGFRVIQVDTVTETALSACIKDDASEAGFDWPAEVFASQQFQARPGESTVLLFTWQALRMWRCVGPEGQVLTQQALRTVHSDPSTPCLRRVLRCFESFVGPEAAFASLPGLNSAALELSTASTDLSSVPLTALHVGEELLRAGLDPDEACAAEESVAWLAAAAWAMCSRQQGGEKYIACWTTDGPKWQDVADPELVDQLLLRSYLNDVPFLLESEPLAERMPRHGKDWLFAAEGELIALHDLLGGATKDGEVLIPLLPLSPGALEAIDSAHTVTLSDQLTLTIGPTLRRGEMLASPGLLQSRNGSLLLELALRRSEGYLVSTLHAPPISYGGADEGLVEKVHERLQLAMLQALHQVITPQFAPAQVSGIAPGSLTMPFV